MATWLNSNFENEFKMEKTSPNGQLPLIPHEQDMVYMAEMNGIENQKQKFESCPQQLPKQQDIGTGIAITSKPFTE